MLVEQFREDVNPPPCEQPVDNLGISPRRKPTHLVLRWRGGGQPTVQEFLGHDVTFAYVMSEGMAGIRDGDAIILYAVHWTAALWGRA